MIENNVQTDNDMEKMVPQLVFGNTCEQEQEIDNKMTFMNPVYIWGN